MKEHYVTKLNSLSFGQYNSFKILLREPFSTLSNIPCIQKHTEQSDHHSHEFGALCLLSISRMTMVLDITEKNVQLTESLHFIGGH